MIRSRLGAVLRWARDATDIWRPVLLASAGLLVVLAGVRIRLPGLKDGAADGLLRTPDGGLLSLYDHLASGGLSRGAVLALGVVPYLSARIFVRLARVAFPAVDALAAHQEGRIKLRWWTRVTTVGVALIQSYGFARFVEAAGAVTDPGAGFVVQTMLLLTGGSILTMWISERITAAQDDEPPVLQALPKAAERIIEAGPVSPVIQRQGLAALLSPLARWMRREP